MEFRLKGRCERCSKRGPVEPHHVFTKGMGGATRLDVKINLLALCRVCHDGFHLGRISRDELLDIIAAREGVTRVDLIEAIWILRRAP